MSGPIPFGLLRSHLSPTNIQQGGNSDSTPIVYAYGLSDIYLAGLAEIVRRIDDSQGLFPLVFS